MSVNSMKKKCIVECPAGKKPFFRKFKNGKGCAVFFNSVCDECPLKNKCRVQKCGKQNREFKYADADLRTRYRRKLEATDEFKKRYGSKRCPIEGLNGRLKQLTPLRRLRIRGRCAVYHSIHAILTMHNIMQMVRHAKIQVKKAHAAVFFQFLDRVFPVFQKNPSSPCGLTAQNLFQTSFPNIEPEKLSPSSTF